MANLRLLSTFWLTAFFCIILNAQTDSLSSASKGNYAERESGWWTMNIDGGVSHMQSDIKSELFGGFGTSISFGRNLSFKPDKLLTSTLRVRLQYTQSKGLDTEIFSGIANNPALNGTRSDIAPLNYNTSPGFIYPNYKNTTLETAIEVPVFINPLRLGSKVHLGLFAGFGIGWYKVELDQRGADNLAYNYGGTAFEFQGLSESDRIETLKKEWDGEYETLADGFENNSFLMSVMPSIGIEVGYIALNDITIGLSHRVTFTRNDLFDGIQWENDNSQSMDNDILHYSSLFIRKDIMAKAKQSYTPVIELTSPLTTKINTQDPIAIIRTNLKHIRSVHDITITHNGNQHDVYQYFNKEFATNIPLLEGENEIIITASNSDGTDQVIYNYTYVPSSETNYRGTRPVIDFIKPEIENQTIIGFKTTIRLDVKGVNHDKDIRIFVNEDEHFDFSYRGRDPFLATDIKLRPGTNKIKILAINNNGVSQVTRSVVVDNSGKLASIDLILPTNNTLETELTQIPIEALINGDVKGKDLELIVNDKSYDFDFDETSRHLQSTVNLIDGTNIVLIKLKTRKSDIEKKISIVRRSREKVSYADEPKLDITNRDDEFVVSEFINSRWDSSIDKCSYNLELLFPKSITGNEVEIFLNNEKIGNLTIFEEEKVVRKALYLSEGNNYLKIRDRSKTIGVYDKIIKCKVDNSYAGTAIIRTNQNQNQPAGQPKQVETNTKSNIGKNVTSNLDPETKNNTNVIIETVSAEPIISINQPNTNSSEISSPKINFKANVQNVKSKGDITLYYNENIVSDFDFDSNTGDLSYSTNASDAKNRITLIAINDQGVADEIRFITYNKLDPPSISIYGPANQATFETNNAQLSGQILRSSSNEILITNNGETLTGWTLSENSLKGNLQLHEGVNKIEVIAKNRTATKSKTLYIYYNPVQKPNITIMNPPTDGVELVNRKYPLIATISSVRSKDRVELIVNGINTKQFNFENGSFNTSLTLKEGLNTVIIKASNKIGRDSKEIALKYRTPKAPSVRISKPLGNSTITKINPYELRANVSHISNSEKIAVKLNGKNIKGINFNPSTQQLSANLNLIEGINEIVIEAENQDGGDAQSANLKYVKPNPPSINLLLPQKELSTENSLLKIQANILRVTNEESIQLLVNGLKRSFNFSESTLKASLILSEGMNTIKILASNMDGQDEQVIKAIYTKPTPPPIINWYAPKESGKEVSYSSFNLRVNLKNVIRKDQITLTNNGRSINFGFDLKTGLLTSSIILSPGNNEINIEARNKTAVTKAKSTINYNKPVDQSSKLPKVRINSISEAEASAFNPSLGQSSIVTTIENIESKDQILLLINTKAITNFVYNPRTKKLVATIMLKKGDNEIVIKATNSFGTARDTKKVSF